MVRGDYQPGNLTVPATYKHDHEPPMSYREVETKSRPVLYDKDERPIYRRAGFTVTR